MPYEHQMEPKYTLTEAEQKTKPYLRNMPDDPGGLPYEELLKILEGYYQRGETDQEEFAKSYAGLETEDDVSEAVGILDKLIETDYQDAITNDEETTTDKPPVESEHSVESLLDETIEHQTEDAEFLYAQLARARADSVMTSGYLDMRTDLLESLDEIVSNRELKKFVKAWRRGEPLAKAWYRIEWIQEYCRTVFNILHPEEALKELIAIREHYGDENDNHYGSYRIGRMIAGCHAALGQFDEAKSELRCTAHESFQQMRRYTDFCLAFGFYKDLINFLKENANGERHLSGGYATAQLIMAYRMLGRIKDALPHLKARVNLDVRDQQLIDNIWSLKLRTGERPEGREVLSVQRSKLRTFGKKNMEMVADTVDVLLEVYVRETGENLLQRWSEECYSSKYVSNLHLISVPGLLNPSKVLRYVKERNLRHYIEVDVKRYSFIDNRSVKAFLVDVTRLAEDLTKAAGSTKSGADIGDSELRLLLQMDAIRDPEFFRIEYTLPPEYVIEPFELDPDYRPPPENITRFKALDWLIPEAYAKRKTDPNAIDETIGLCKEQIALEYDSIHYSHLYWRYTLAQRKRNSIYYEDDPEHLEVYLEQARDFHYGPCKAYKRLAIILEMRKEYAEALKYVVKAKSRGGNGDWDKRIVRLLKKMNK